MRAKTHINIDIRDLTTLDEKLMLEVASLLVDGFRQLAPNAWPTIEVAMEEVQQSRGADRISRVALNEGSAVLGWIGGIRQYGGHVWELHPLVVRVDHQGQGIGRALVSDLEEQVRRRGGDIVWVGTDDEDDRTSLAGIDLFPNPLDHLSRLQNLRSHPFGFYQKMGFVVTGVMPDANGFGKPDIFMAKRVVNMPRENR